MTNNKVLNNFFEKSEIDYINNLIIQEKINRTIQNSDYGRHHQSIDSSKMYIKKIGLSRLNIYDIKINNNKILSKIINTAKTFYCGEGQILEDTLQINYCRYSKEYSGNNPELGVHIDSGDFSFIIDYQLKSNCDWPIYFNDKKFILNDNSAIFFHPLVQYHWRPIKDWNEEEYLEMIFFEFKTTSQLMYNNNIEELNRLSQYRKEIYKDEQ